jgi:hypothetical protein
MRVLAPLLALILGLALILDLNRNKLGNSLLACTAYYVL